MSRQLAQSDLFSEREDSLIPKDMLQGIEVRLRDLLISEREKAVAELEFLKEVHSGMSGGADVEFRSTTYVDSFLRTELSKYF